MKYIFGITFEIFQKDEIKEIFNFGCGAIRLFRRKVLKFRHFPISGSRVYFRVTIIQIFY